MVSALRTAQPQRAVRRAIYLAALAFVVLTSLAGGGVPLAVGAELSEIDLVVINSTNRPLAFNRPESVISSRYIFPRYGYNSARFSPAPAGIPPHEITHVFARGKAAAGLEASLIYHDLLDETARVQIRAVAGKPGAPNWAWVVPEKGSKIRAAVTVLDTNVTAHTTRFVVEVSDQVVPTPTSGAPEPPEKTPDFNAEYELYSRAVVKEECSRAFALAGIRAL